MAGNDIAMNAFKVLTDVAYVYGEASDSSQGKIGKSDLISLLLGIREKLGIKISNENGPTLLKPNVGIVFAYDSTNTSKYLIYAYIRNDGELANIIPVIQRDQSNSVKVSKVAHQAFFRISA